MKKITSLFVMSILLFSACQEDKVGDQLLGNNAENSAIEVRDGFLNFSNDEIFETYMKSLEEIKNRSCKILKFKGFTSIAQFESINFRSLNEEEEMTQDEYNLMKAENLILDPLLTAVLDTTLRIRVSNRIYKITEYGTFSANISDSAYIKSKIFNFNLTEAKKYDGLVDLGNGVTFINSFKNDSVIVDEVDSVSMNRSLSGKPIGFCDEYNVKSYNWENTSLWKSFWDRMRGTSVSKENKFSRKRRVKVNVYDVNYLFYASSGISVKMQKRKKFWFVKYWVSQEADKLAIGFDKLYGSLILNNPRSNMTINPTNSTKWNSLKSTINGYESNFIYGNYNKFEGIKEWTDNIISYLPEIGINGEIYPNNTIRDAIFNSPADLMVSTLKSLTGKYIYRNIEREIKPKDPKSMYLVWGDNSIQYNKEKTFITGVKEYSNLSSKTVKFNESYGFSFNSGDHNGLPIGGYLPTKFTIKAIDAFGAAYYDGKWKGIRFIKN